jgi:hypothetical protein
MPFFVKPKTTALLGALALGVAGAAMADAGTATTPAIDPEADALIKKMSDFMGGLKSFSADLQVTDNQIMDDGFKLALIKQGAVRLQRPDHLYVSRTGLERDQEAFFDGKTLTFHDRGRKLHAKLSVEGDIDAALDAATEHFGAELPARDLLSPDAYTPLMDAVEEAVHLGVVPVGEMRCHQIALRTEEVDAQLWIQEGSEPVPCRYTITSKWITGAPQYTVSMSHWKIDPDLPADRFELDPSSAGKAVSPAEYLAAGK